jgi:predicted flap endonuclease-1-like 5' DNA nuclease
MSYSIKDLKDVPAGAAQKLASLGVNTTEQLLDGAGAAAGRKRIAEEIGAPVSQVLTWVNEADLMRIPGVAEGFSQLLEAAGVDTVKELAARNSENLSAKLAEVNGRLQLTGRVPTPEQVAAWIESAKGLAPKVSH